MFVGTELERYQQLVKQHQVHEFADRYPGLYLFGHVAKASPEGDLDFYTGIINVRKAPGTRKSKHDPAREPIGSGAFLIKLEKKSSSGWASWYSVGRTNNNDVVIRHHSVSKFHSRLDTQGPLELPSADDKSLWITDQGSTKGTLLNGVRLEHRIRYPLQLEDNIVFGEVEAQLFDAIRLHHRLSVM